MMVTMMMVKWTLMLCCDDAMVRKWKMTMKWTVKRKRCKRRVFFLIMVMVK